MYTGILTMSSKLYEHLDLISRLGLGYLFGSNLDPHQNEVQI